MRVEETDGKKNEEKGEWEGEKERKDNVEVGQSAREAVCPRSVVYRRQNE